MRMRARSPRLSAREERGFSLVVAIVVLAAATLLLFAAFDAVFDNVQVTRNNLDQQRALLAAQAGLSAYEQQLSANQNYWTTCPGPNGTTGVSGVTGATSAAVPGGTDDGSTERYRYANLPATGTTYTGCSAANPIASTIQGTTGTPGTFRVKVIGYSQPTSGSNPISRTLVAQFEPNSFLNFVYFTNYEDSDPQWLPPETDAECEVYAWAGRSSSCRATAFGTGDSVNGPMHSNDDVSICGGSGTSTSFGRPNQTPADQIEAANVFAEGNGCTGTFTVDGVQGGADDTNSGTLPMPPGDGQLAQVADGGNSSLGSSSTLANDCSASAGCEFDGPTTIVLDGPTSSTNNTNRMTVTNGGVTATLPYPTNGVVYVAATASCNYSYSPFGSTDQLYGGTTLDTTSGDNDNAGCGDAVVSGSTSASSCPGTTQVSGVCPYTQSLTIGAANDIIIAGSLTTTSTTSGCATGQLPSGTVAAEASCPTGTAVLGLIANNNVRIYHPLVAARYTGETEQSCLESTGGTQDAYLNTNGTGSLTNPVIDAAILAVNDSFIVDNFDCGTSSVQTSPGNSNLAYALGDLTINGAIAQNFRGRVSEYNGASGYVKNYWYDSRLESIAPPYFLNPVSASWQVNWVTECDNTANC
jgi:Tfp pilus assembly protein PilX